MDPALQAAVYGALTGAGLTVHDAAPESGDTTFPYVQIGPGQAIADDTQCANGFVTFFDLHVWSRENGMNEVRGIATTIRTALHQIALAVAGFTTVHAFFESARFLNDPDGKTRHGIVTIRLLARET